MSPINTADVIEAMRSIQTESERWNLAEALRAEIPTGTQGFTEIVDQATAAGVAGSLSANTLRLYRDTANRWPADQRVPNVSFSAHREAMVLPSIQAAVKMLSALSAQLGAGKVTVASVRKAIAVQNGKSVPGASPTSTSAPQAARVADVLSDLMNGAPQLIAAITPTTGETELDKFHAGLTKAIAHVERLRAKAVRSAKAASKKSATPPAASTTTPAAKAGTTRKPQGDLRGL